MNEAGITKIEAARQFNAAIRMLFRNDDPLAVHTVAMVGLRILRDLAKNRGLEHTVDSMIRLGKEREFWGAVNDRANFLKHADRDSLDILTPFPEHANDSLLMIASTYYEFLGKPPTLEMWGLAVWYCSIHPDVLSKDVDPAMRALVHLSSDIQGLPRGEQLARGFSSLEMVLAQPQLGRMLDSAWERAQAGSRSKP